MDVRPHLATLVADFRRHGDGIAVVTHRGNRRFATSWAELADLSSRCARAFAQHGLAVGDRVLLWGENSAEWVAVFFGCVLRGIVVVPLDAAGSPEFARRVQAEVRPRLLAGDRELLDLLPGGVLPGGAETPRLYFDSFAETLAETLSGAGEDLARSPIDPPSPALSRESPLQIVFTSGTTAEPKGIVHTHGNVLASLDPLEAEIARYLRYERFVHPLRILNTLPLSHVFGQFMGLWVPPLLGAEAHYETRLQAPRIVGLLRRERISVLAAPPRILDLLRTQALAEEPALQEKLAEARGLPVWKRWWRLRRLHRRFGWKFWAFVSGGAALPAELERFWTTAGFALIQGYGMTETTALVTLNHPFKTALGSIGRPLAGRELRLGPDGEILVRGATVSRQIWRGGRLEDRGEEWLATGDLAAHDERGELIFAGRKSDVIVTAAGVNIHPEDLEAALRTQAGLRDALVISYQSPAGPAPAAVLILRDPLRDPDRTADAAIAAANRELGDFQQIRYRLVWPQPDFPRTSTGKVIRRQVQAWAQQALDAPPAESSAQGATSGLAPPGDPLAAALARLAGAQGEVGDGERLSEDLHLDSLALVQLHSAVEAAYSVEIDDAAWQRLRTVGDLRGLIRGPEAVRAAEPARSASVASARPDSPSAPSAAAGEVRSRPPVFSRWSWWPPVRIARICFLQMVSQPLVKLLLAPRTGAVPEMREPSLLIANHVTAFDVPILLSALPARERGRVAVAMSGELLASWRRGQAERHRAAGFLAPAAYWLVTALFNVFPLPRGAGLRQSFEHAGRALDRRYHVLVFPEGRRSAGDLGEFEPGIGLLAQQSQAPVLPIYLQGLGRLKSREKFWFRSGLVAVRFGRPLRFQPGEDPAQFAQRLFQAVRALSENASDSETGKSAH